MIKGFLIQIPYATLFCLHFKQRPLRKHVHYSKSRFDTDSSGQWNDEVATKLSKLFVDCAL